MAKQYTEEFKKDAVRYWQGHRELGISKCAKNLGIGKSTLSQWTKVFNENDGAVPFPSELWCPQNYSVPEERRGNNIRENSRKLYAGNGN